RLRALLGEAPLARRAAGPRRPARLRRRGHLGEHRAELLETVRHVPLAGAVALARQRELTGSADAAAEARPEARAHRAGERAAACHVPVEERLALHFVDVLAARPRAPREREAQLRPHRARESDGAPSLE